MDLEKELMPEIYTAIKAHYESQSFSNAIIDAMKSLTEQIRAKSKMDNDGASLVGQAFGGNSPLIKISPMQKISEVDEQKGFEQLLRGLYTGIRNPRTHENFKDNKEACDAIILFINYICKRVRDSKSFFELEEFKKRIFDPLFVEKAEYAEILVGEIPNDDLVNTTITILHERSSGDPNKLQYFFEAVFNRADAEQQQSIIKVFSNELKLATTDTDIIGLIRFIKPKLWPLIDSDTKLRIENRIIASVKEGYYDNGQCKKGALGAWGNSLGQYFKLKTDLSSGDLGDVVNLSIYRRCSTFCVRLAYVDLSCRASPFEPAAIHSQALPLRGICRSAFALRVTGLIHPQQDLSFEIFLLTREANSCNNRLTS